MTLDVSGMFAVAPDAYPIGQLMFVVIDEDIGAKGTQTLLLTASATDARVHAHACTELACHVSCEAMLVLVDPGVACIGPLSWLPLGSILQRT